MASDLRGELRPGNELGPFLIERELGRGAMGIVYLARHAETGAQVALKLLLDDLSGNDVFVRRFQHEARAAREVQHRHLVSVVDVGEAAGRQYLAVDYVDGPSLRRRLDADGPLELAELARVTRHLGSALDALHGAGLVHRDVKPTNVMLDPERGAMLTDFGLAKGEAYTVLTTKGQILGTPAYMAPELVGGAEATPASDMYALGCVLFECAAGRPPFGGGNVFELLMAHVDREPPDPCAERPDLPPAVGDALRHTLAKDPTARPRTGRMLAQMLAHAAP